MGCWRLRPRRLSLSDPGKHILDCTSPWLLLRTERHQRSHRVYKCYTTHAHRCGEPTTSRGMWSLTRAGVAVSKTLMYPRVWLRGVAKAFPRPRARRNCHPQHPPQVFTARDRSPTQTASLPVRCTAHTGVSGFTVAGALRERESAALLCAHLSFHSPRYPGQAFGTRRKRCVEAERPWHARSQPSRHQTLCATKHAFLCTPSRLTPWLISARETGKQGSTIA